MIYGTHLIEFSLLIILVCRYLKLLKNLLSYGQNTYAHIWA